MYKQPVKQTSAETWRQKVLQVQTHSNQTGNKLYTVSTKVHEYLTIFDTSFHF